jgi:hypothetical protein
MDITHPDLKYLGEALFLLGIAYKLLRWVYRTEAEVDGVDPGSFWSRVGTALNPFSGLADLVDNINQLLGRGKYASSNITVIVQPAASLRANTAATATSAGHEPAPETLLDILTPEQRKLVLEQLAQNEKRDS